MTYKAKLAVIESERVDIEYSSIYNILIFREDRTFRTNIGISIRGIARAAKANFCRGKSIQGASTIRQQLFRSLYLEEYGKTLRRKVVELFGAIRIKTAFEDEETLDLYVNSVRYAPGIIGIAAAVEHFDMQKHLTVPECFVLVERISRVANTFKLEGIRRSLNDAVGHQVMTEQERDATLELYTHLKEIELLSLEA